MQARVPLIAYTHEPKRKGIRTLMDSLHEFTLRKSMNEKERMSKYSLGMPLYLYEEERTWNSSLEGWADLTVKEVVLENIKSDLEKDKDEQGKKKENKVVITFFEVGSNKDSNPNGVFNDVGGVRYSKVDGTWVSARRIEDGWFLFDELGIKEEYDEECGILESRKKFRHHLEGKVGVKEWGMIRPCVRISRELERKRGGGGETGVGGGGRVGDVGCCGGIWVIDWNTRIVMLARATDKSSGSEVLRAQRLAEYYFVSRIELIVFHFKNCDYKMLGNGSMAYCSREERAIGPFIWGYGVGMLYGEKKMSFLGLSLLTGIAGLASASARNFRTLVVLRTFAGIGTGGTQLYIP
ncbi:retrotransposon-related protein [Tanacetum coccineum]